MACDYVSEVKCYPGNGGNLVARGSFVVGDALAVNFSVFKGQDGQLRVVLPNTVNPKFDASRPAGKDNKKFFDEVRPISADARTELEALILSKIEGGNEVASHDSQIPF